MFFFDLDDMRKPIIQQEYYHIKKLPKNFYGKMVFFNDTADSNLKQAKKLPVGQKERFCGVLVEIMNKFDTYTEENDAFIDFFNNTKFYIKTQGSPILSLSPSIDHLFIDGGKFYDKNIDKYSDEYLGKFCPQEFSIYPGQEFSLHMIIGLHKLKTNLKLKMTLSPKIERLKQAHKCKCELNVLMGMGCQCGGI
jgi:hypothetical protein